MVCCISRVVVDLHGKVIFSTFPELTLLMQSGYFHIGFFHQSRANRKLFSSLDSIYTSICDSSYRTSLCILGIRKCSVNSIFNNTIVGKIRFGLIAIHQFYSRLNFSEFYWKIICMQHS